MSSETESTAAQHPVPEKIWSTGPDYATITAMDTTYDVLIVSHNSAETLSACLEAVRRLEPQPSEVLVVDNASSDNSREIARSFDCHSEDLDKNRGFTGGMNHGIELLKSPWILSLNPDCAPDRDFTARLFDSIQQVPGPEKIGSATGLLMRTETHLLQPGPVVDSAGIIVTPSGRHFDRFAGRILAELNLHPAWVFGGTGAATLFRREALTDVAYKDGAVFAPTFFAYREDAELAWRLQWRGWSCLFEPRAMAAHRRRLRPEEGRRGLPHQINRYSVRNRFLMRIHCADLGWHLRCFPHWFLRDLMVIAACLSVETSSLPGILDLLRLRADALARRNWVLSRRKISSRQMGRHFRRPEGWVEEITPG